MEDMCTVIDALMSLVDLRKKETELAELLEKAKNGVCGKEKT